MTIRTRLIAAAFVSSAVVALATSASTLFLYRASSHLHAIHTEMIPMVTQAGDVEDDAGELAQMMEDFMDAKTAGDNAGDCRHATRLTLNSGGLYTSIDFLAHDAPSINTDDRRQYLAEFGRFRQGN